jgi:hypothetical protein
MSTFPCKFLLANYVPCSVTADALKAKFMPGIVRCYNVGDIVSYKKFLWEDGHGYCISEKKKTELK